MTEWIPVIVAAIALVKVVLGMLKGRKHVATIGVLVNVLEDMFNDMDDGKAFFAKSKYIKDSIKEKATKAGVEKILHTEVKKRTP